MDSAVDEDFDAWKLFAGEYGRAGFTNRTASALLFLGTQPI